MFNPEKKNWIDNTVRHLDENMGATNRKVVDDLEESKTKLRLWIEARHNTTQLTEHERHAA